jgi:hypothetical protein
MKTKHPEEDATEAESHEVKRLKFDKDMDEEEDEVDKVMSCPAPAQSSSDMPESSTDVVEEEKDKSADMLTTDDHGMYFVQWGIFKSHYVICERENDMNLKITLLKWIDLWKDVMVLLFLPSVPQSPPVLRQKIPLMTRKRHQRGRLSMAPPTDERVTTPWTSQRSSLLSQGMI